MDCTDIPYNIDYTPLTKINNANLVVLQIPDGLRQYTPCLLDEITRRINAHVIIDADPTYGSCDFHYPRIKGILGADTIIHIAHTPYPPDLSWSGVEPGDSPRIVYLQARSMLEPSTESINHAIELLREIGAGEIGLLSTVQHTHILPKISEELSRKGFNPLIPPGNLPYFEPGQVIGCDYRVARRVRVDAYVIVSGGLFHPLGLYLSTFKPVIQLDPYRSEAVNRTMEFERIYRSRLFKISEAIDAEKWGLIVGLKTGQYRPGLVKSIESLLRRKKRDYEVYVAESLNEERLRSIDRDDIQAWIVTSCPRIPLDDLHSYEKPVLTPGEARMALMGKLEPYIFPW